MAPVVKPTLHFDAVELSRRVVSLHRLQNVNFNLRRVAVFLNVADDLDGAVAAEFPVPALKHAAERTLPEWREDLINRRDVFAELVLVVSILRV